MNETMSPGQPVAVLNVGGQIEISVGLPESVINSVRAGMRVEVTVASLSEQSFAGEVTEVAPSIDVDAATYPVAVRITDPSAEIRPGMAANVAFDLSAPQTSERVLVVPVKAVGEDGVGRFVFVIEIAASSAVVKKRHVQIGELTVDGFEIREGLSAGEKIATAGLQTLLDGQHVQRP